MSDYRKDINMNVKLDWENIVGKDNAGKGAGYYGDLMAVGNLTLKPIMDSGQLTQEAAGVAYAQLIDSSMSKAIEFERAQTLLKLEKIKSPI